MPVYLKRYHYAGWRTSQGLIGRGTLWGTAPEVSEFRALTWLRAHDVCAVRPLAAAARTRAGRLVAHALLTEVVPDVRDLSKRMRSKDDPLLRGAAGRRTLLAALGRTLGRMHRLGFVHRDCHARNILVADNPLGHECGEGAVWGGESSAGEHKRAALWLLDCRRGGVGGRKGPDFDLATLDQDLSAYFSRPERHRALAAYLDEVGSGADARGLARRIAAQRRALPPSTR